MLKKIIEAGAFFSLNKYRIHSNFRMTKFTKTIRWLVL